MEWGETPATSCMIRGGRGDPVRLELIHDRGILASTIWCRQGGAYSTSIAEALRFCCGSSTSQRHQVIRSRWLGDGRRQRIHAGREPSSCLLSILGGDAWRTPASSGGDTCGLDCFDSVSCKVFFVNCNPLSSNSKVLRASSARGSLQIVYLPLLME
jgi:hypothetical protein